MRFNNKKAQFWSMDMLFAVIIFGIAVTIILYVWFDINNQIAIGYQNNPTILELQSYSVSTTLLSPGDPQNWQFYLNLGQQQNISVGLTSGYNNDVILPSKLYAFMGLASTNYQVSKEMLGTSFDYYVEITNKNLNIDIGRNPSAYNALTSYITTESGILNGQPVEIKIILWTNSTIESV